MRTSQGTYVYVHADGFLRHSPAKTTIDITVRRAKAVTFALSHLAYLRAHEQGLVTSMPHLNDHARFEIHQFNGYVELKSPFAYLRLKNGNVVSSPTPGHFTITPL
jgi:uncharacterized protein YigA (DUF484 family)